MDELLIWKSLIIFILSYILIFMIIYTFHPSILNNTDKAKNGKRGCSGYDCYLSAKGRTKVFLYSFIISLSLSIAFILYVYFIKKKTILNLEIKG